jgi:hypothetical protein
MAACSGVHYYKNSSGSSSCRTLLVRVERQFKLIEDPGGFLVVCKRLEKADALGVDFECEYNLYRCGMHLCLIQVSDGNNIYVIDPLTLPLQPLWNILQDPEIPIIVHAPGSVF